MLLHRKNDSREANSRSVIGCAAPGGSVGRVVLGAKQEGRARQNAGDTSADAGIEIAALVARVLVQRQRPSHFLIHDRVPKGAPSSVDSI